MIIVYEKQKKEVRIFKLRVDAVRYLQCFHEDRTPFNELLNLSLDELNNHFEKKEIEIEAVEDGEVFHV